MATPPGRRGHRHRDRGTHARFVLGFAPTTFLQLITETASCGRLSTKPRHGLEAAHRRRAQCCQVPTSQILAAASVELLLESRIDKLDYSETRSVRPSPGCVTGRTGDPGTGVTLMPVDPAWLTLTMTALVEKHQVPGAQLAVHCGGATVTVEVGELEHGTGIPVTRETAFPIGSISKAWTATLAMILVADGDLELDASLDEHLPELDDLGRELTLGQLLSHTSGLACSPDAPDLSTLSMRRYVREYCRRQDLILPPGTGFSYSNRNYILVGHLRRSQP